VARKGRLSTAKPRENTKVIKGRTKARALSGATLGWAADNVGAPAGPVPQRPPIGGMPAVAKHVLNILVTPFLS
jgi:hypothetical protein